jgi:hypothetical protein
MWFAIGGMVYQEKVEVVIEPRKLPVILCVPHILFQVLGLVPSARTVSPAAIRAGRDRLYSATCGGVLML